MTKNYLANELYHFFTRQTFPFLWKKLVLELNHTCMPFCSDYIIIFSEVTNEPTTIVSNVLSNL